MPSVGIRSMAVRRCEDAVCYVANANAIMFSLLIIKQ